MHCPHCAVNYDSRQAACLNCGEMLKNGKRCEDCGGLNHEQAFVCSLCGLPLRTDLRKVARERLDSIQTAPRICTHCGTQYSEPLIFCRQCGHPVCTRPRYALKSRPGFAARILEFFQRRAA